MFEEGFPELNPLTFFQIAAPCYYLESEKALHTSKYTLPETTFLSGEEKFAKVQMGWNEEGLHFLCETDGAFQDAFYPDVRRGDSLELFIDTRDNKKSGFNTKFCHHFFFLPQGEADHKQGEITSFRTEDAHPLASSKDLILKTELQKKGIVYKIFIPRESLYGYDPKEFDRIGFTYRVNRLGRVPQHFSVSSDEFSIEEQPSLWSSLTCVNENKPIPRASGKRS